MAKRAKVPTSVKVADLKPDKHNANRGTERGYQALENSLQQYGAGRSILIDRNGNVIAGNKTLEKAGAAGIEDVQVVETDGNVLVAVKRTDLDLETDPEARELAYADNIVGQLSLDWDPNQLMEDIENGLEIPFFLDFELEDLIGNQQSDDENIYSQKINIPTYEPSDNKPTLPECYDDAVAKELIREIRASDLPEEEKDFLIMAAGRHVKINFETVADYYAHSDMETQKLMEDNALVIVDYDKAIEKGWVRLSERIDDQYDDELGSEEEASDVE